MMTSVPHFLSKKNIYFGVSLESPPNPVNYSFSENITRSTYTVLGRTTLPAERVYNVIEHRESGVLESF